jgi:hypothetical protein
MYRRGILCRQKEWPTMWWMVWWILNLVKGRVANTEYHPITKYIYHKHRHSDRNWGKPNMGNNQRRKKVGEKSNHPEVAWRKGWSLYCHLKKATWLYMTSGMFFWITNIEHSNGKEWLVLHYMKRSVDFLALETKIREKNMANLTFPFCISGTTVFMFEIWSLP